MVVKALKAKGISTYLTDQITFPAKFCRLYRVRWLLLVVIATQEAEIGGIAVQGQLRPKVYKTPSQPIKDGMAVLACHSS
jgi:hypothetical protein